MTYSPMKDDLVSNTMLNASQIEHACRVVAIHRSDISISIEFKCTLQAHLDVYHRTKCMVKFTLRKVEGHMED